LIWQIANAVRMPYLIFAVSGSTAIIVTRSFALPRRLATIVLTFMHGVAGVVVFLHPQNLPDLKFQEKTGS